MSSDSDRRVYDRLSNFVQPHSRRSFLRRSLAAAGALTLPGLLAACGDDDDDTPEPGDGQDTNTPTSAADAQPTNTSAPEPAGTSTSTSATVPAGAPTNTPAPQATEEPDAEPTESDAADFPPPVVVLPVDPETLDPHFGESGPMGTVLGNVMEALIEYDRDMNVAPGLAESWEVLEDNVTWEFVLRQGVTFQNGEPFNAEAVKFTVERTMDEALRGQGLNDPFPSRTGVQSVSVIDDSTVQMVLAEPNIVLPVFVTFLYILEPGYYSSTSIQDTALNPVGTGPWRVTEWVSGDHVTLERFDDYWRGTPPIPTITMRPIPERATRLNLLLAGEADIVGDLTPDDFPAIEGNDKLRVSRAPGSRRMHIGVPTNVPRYQDRRVRRALQMAIDFEGISEGLLGPMAPEERRPTVLVSSTEWEGPEIPLIEYDPEQAQSELEAAGFAFNEQVRIISPQGRYLKDTEVAQIIAGNLRDIGIDAEAEILDWTVYTDRMRADQGLGDLYLLGLGSRFYGPEDVSIVTTGQIWDQTHWIDNTENGQKFQEMYTQLTQTFDVDEQHRMVEEMLMLFHEEYVWMPLWIQPAATAVNERLTFEDSGGGNRFNFWLPEEDPVRVTG